MNLIQIRKKFRELSGRFDLVNEDHSDNGADFFINEGSKFLDRMDETQKSWATRFASLALDGFFVEIPYCRAIKEVWTASPTNGRWQLEKMNLQDLLDSYLTTLPAEIESGIPLYYSPCVTRSVPPGVSLSSYQEYLGYVEVTDYNYNAILLNVPTDEAITIVVHGLFYQPVLTSDSDTNYWSEVHPLLLCTAALRQLEVINRNTQGVLDWTNAISTEMNQLGRDLVEELIAEADQMEG